MTMTEQLAHLREQSAAQLPQDALRINHGFTEKLASSGLVERAKAAGDPAPQFELANAAGDTVRSKELLARGPLVLTFYRGNW